MTVYSRLSKPTVHSSLLKHAHKAEMKFERLAESTINRIF